MTIKTHTLFLLLLATLGAQGQTAVWQLQPQSWRELTRMGLDLYKAVRTDGQAGLLRSDGTEVLPVSNCQMGLFHEGKALVTQTDPHGQRIVGCLTADGQYHPFARTYYTLTGQHFYSDDLLTVSDELGRLGYVDPLGIPQIGFDGKLTRIKPFTEGHAVIVRGKKYALINKRGEEQHLVIGGTGVGEITSFTNPYHGIVYAYDSYNERFYTYDIRTKAPMKPNSSMKGKEKSMDYLYCFQAVSGRGKEVPFEQPKSHVGRQGLAPTAEGGLYGYGNSERTVLPCQFEEAEPFMDNLATVSLHGRKGILRWVESGNFRATPATQQHDFYAGESVQCKFAVALPEAWQGKPVEVSVTDDGGNSLPVRSNATGYTFTQTPRASQQCRYTIHIHSQGLHLWSGSLTCTFTRKEHPVSQPVIKQQPTEKTCPDCGKPLSQCPVGGKHYKAH